MTYKKKVLQVVSCLEYGGTESYIMNNFRNLNDDNIIFDFLVFIKKDYPYEKEINYLGGNIYFCGSPGIRNIFNFLNNIKKCIKENGPYEAIHCHVNIANAWVLLIAKLSGIKVRISHSHDSSGKETKNIIKKLYYKFQELIIKSCATHKLACSIDAGNYLYGNRYFKKYGQFVCNGIKINNFFKVDERHISNLKQEFKIKDDDFIIMNITRFEKKKNQEFIVDVFNNILKYIPEAVLILGGVDGGQLEYIKKKVELMGIGDKVRFIGVRDDIKEWLQIANIYLFPSLYEGLGIVLLEAQASGLKCIASTGVSRQVDLGINLVDFLELNKGSEYWAKYIYINKKYISPTEEVIKDAFNKNNFTIEKSVKEIKNIYLGE